MSDSSSDFVHPSESELLVAGQTMQPVRRESAPVQERLAAAFALLQSVEKTPTEASLVFMRDPGAAIEMTPIGKGLTVGRGREATLCLEKCSALSRRHFGVRPHSGAWILEDLGSRNGTMVDGVEGRVIRRMLRDGDIVFAGDLMFLFVSTTD